MNIKEGKDILTYDDIEAIQRHTTSLGSYYRGLASTNYRLLSSLTREIEKVENARKADAYIWNKISTNKVICGFFKYPIGKMSREQEWELALLCRHSGVLSRIMDFTPNTKIACWFASIEKENEDGVVWEMVVPRSIRAEKGFAKFPSPCEISETQFFRSVIVDKGEKSFSCNAVRNAIHQSSFSFIQSIENAIIPLDLQNIDEMQLIRHRIPAASKKIIVNVMKDFKVAQKYPDFVYAEDAIVKNEIEKINEEAKKLFND